MSRAGIGGMLAVVGFGLTAHGAWAQDAKPRLTVTENRPAAETGAQWGKPGPLTTFEWDDKRRWGLKLELQQPTPGVDLKAGDLAAGAYFRVTPSLRVGLGAGVDEKSKASAPQPAPLAPGRKSDADPAEVAPRVRLESAFRF